MALPLATTPAPRGLAGRRARLDLRGRSSTFGFTVRLSLAVASAFAVTRVRA